VRVDRAKHRTQHDECILGERCPLVVRLVSQELGIAESHVPAYAPINVTGRKGLLVELLALLEPVPILGEPGTYRRERSIAHVPRPSLHTLLHVGRVPRASWLGAHHWEPCEHPFTCPYEVEHWDRSSEYPEPHSTALLGSSSQSVFQSTVEGRVAFKEGKTPTSLSLYPVTRRPRPSIMLRIADQIGSYA
jgi:hypothetical protein